MIRLLAAIAVMMALGSVSLSAQSSQEQSNNKLQTSNFKLQTTTGKASFYSRKATGSRTANGERLHPDSLTCAHLKYPFGTVLKVTNLTNGRQVVVRVNDRGPYRKGRIIDLSWGAAKELGMIAQGIVPVTVEKVSTANIPYRLEEPEADVPRYDFEIADIAAEGIVPIWQQHLSPRIDQRKAQRSMQQTVAETTKDIMEATVAPAFSSTKTAAPASSSAKTTATTPAEQAQDDALEEINAHPHSSKAYLKRQGKR